LTLHAEPDDEQEAAASAARRSDRGRVFIPVVRASEQELAAHEAVLRNIDKASGGKTVFRSLP
jgi:DNA polymerase-3 subunit epsilon